MIGLTRDLLDWLRDRSGSLEAAGAWPNAQLSRLGSAGVLGWSVPREYGGSAVTENELLEGYLRLAASCLTTAFVLTQRNGACQRIAASGNQELRTQLLPGLARGELFATVGISHLTTSRQHLTRPAVTAEPIAGGLRISGEVPWVTGAPHADYIVTGGTLPDLRQVLVALPAKAPGVTVNAPVRLLALTGSQTSSVSMAGVEVDDQHVIAGPTEQVMKSGGASTGSLATSALAIGLSQAAIDGLRAESQARPDLAETLAPLENEAAELERWLIDSAAAPAGPQSETIRTRANSLALRTTQSLLAASKGAGFVAGHFAERSVREALFFLVWSCPQPVVAAALRELAGISACS